MGSVASLESWPRSKIEVACNETRGEVETEIGRWGAWGRKRWGTRSGCIRTLANTG